MERDGTDRSKAWAMFKSWLSGLICVSLFSGFIGLVYFRQVTEPNLVWCLHWALLFFVGYTVCWMIFGKVTLIEGQFLFAEYGGTGNRLQRIHLRDGRVWKFSEPLNIRLWSGPKSGCALYVAVCENFLGRVSILYRMVNLYNGENEWFDDDASY